MVIDKETTWIISDPHYGHPNIVKGVSVWDDKTSCRDFKSVEEMNQALVEEINSKVQDDDTLVCLGDWSFGGIENIWNFRKQIRCKNIHLVLGNHDEKIAENRELPNVSFEEAIALQDKKYAVSFESNAYAQDVFSSVQSYLELEYKGSRRKVACFHYPIQEWNGKHKGWIHLCGHSHNLSPQMSMKNRFNASYEMKVYKFSELIKLIEKLNKKFDE